MDDLQIKVLDCFVDNALVEFHDVLIYMVVFLPTGRL